tara:strand:- start:803 stop:1387 length:585 start_codon:yes stop_codon:yes gene_type:complete
MSKFWKEIWDSKGKSSSTDLLFLDGYDHLKIDFSSENLAKDILSHFDIKLNDSILEAGCGAGFLAREMQNYQYVGVDYSDPLIRKHKELFPHHEVITAEANDLPFGDGTFDWAFCYGLFQYLDNDEYANKVISELDRVSRKGFLLGDLKISQTREEHYVYKKSNLKEIKMEISECLYDTNDIERFNAYKIKKVP